MKWCPHILFCYLRAVKSHAGKHSLGHAGPLQLVPDLLIDVGGNFGPCQVEARFNGAAGAHAGQRDGWVVEELLVDSLWVLMGQQATDGQLLVDNVGHGELLAYELRGEQPAMAQKGMMGGCWMLSSQGATGVVLAGRVGHRVMLGGGLWVPKAALDGKRSSSQGG